MLIINYFLILIANFNYLIINLNVVRHNFGGKCHSNLKVFYLSDDELYAPPPTQAGSSRSQSSGPTLCTCTGGGLQWTSDQPVAETSTSQHPRWRKTCPLVGFEPTISAGERSQTYTSESAVSGTGIKKRISILIYNSIRCITLLILTIS